jgi:hypothetical protein
MKLTTEVIADIDGQFVSVNTSDNRSFIGKVIGNDGDNIKLSQAGNVGSTAGGKLSKERISYIDCSVITSLTILEQ